MGDLARGLAPARLEVAHRPAREQHLAQPAARVGIDPQAELDEAPAEDRVPRVAVGPRPRVVHVDHRAVLDARDRDRQRAAAEHALQALARSAQLGECPVAVGDVGERRDHAALAGEIDQLAREQHLADLAAPPANVQLEVAHRAARAQQRVDAHAVGRLDQHVERFERAAHDLAARVPEEYAPRVVHLDHAVIADAVDQHRVGAGAEDARKELARLAKRALRFHLRGDVAADPAVAAKLSRGIEHRLAAGDGVAHAAVGSAADEQEIAERPVRFDLGAVRGPRRGVALLERQFPSPAAYRIERKSGVEAGRKLGEAEVLVLLPVPVDREIG